MERYTVLKRIGVGTYGSAYLVALKSGANVQYVLKKIKLDKSNDKESAQAEMEVTVLAQLDHPLVLGYVDHFKYKDHLCIVTDHCEGGDLYELLRERKTPLSESAVLDLFVQTVLAIQYVHQQSILHRDLKTQNIFLTREGNVKLGDFGIARSLNSTMDLASTIIGTPYYMSPEVMSSLPYDYKSDMWSMGCVLYEMMSLKHAFDATDMSSLVLKILRGEHLPIPQQFSPEIKDLVKQLLAKSPKQRPSPEQILKLPFLKEYVARARATVAQLQAQAPPRRRPASMMDNDSDLDRELEAAKERLRRIQLERDALNKQSQNAQKEQATTSGRGGGAQFGGGAAAAVPVPRRSVAPGPPRLERPSQSRSPQPAPAAAKALPPEDSSLILDPRARATARKQEEIRRREAELLEARKSYFEERKHADMKMKQMYQPTAGVGHSTGGSVALTNSNSSRRTVGMDSSPCGSNPHAGGAAGGFAQHRGTATIDSSDDDDFEERFKDSHRGAAARELEAELSAAPQQPAEFVPLVTFNSGALGDKIKAVRSLCSQQLGAQLFELIYGFLRQRNAGHDGHRNSLNDDQVFQQELMTRLGSNRMQYVHLIDQLVYFEDQAGRG